MVESAIPGLPVSMTRQFMDVPLVPVAGGDVRFPDPGYHHPGCQLLILPQLPFGLEPMFLVMALLLSPQYPNLVGLFLDCLAGWGGFRHL
jgi:hypothetical protein